MKSVLGYILIGFLTIWPVYILMLWIMASVLLPHPLGQILGYVSASLATLVSLYTIGKEQAHYLRRKRERNVTPKEQI